MTSVPAAGFVQFTPYGWPEPGPQYLAPTAALDFDHPAVARFAREAVQDAVTPTDKAVRLFMAVRDGVRYDPYSLRMTLPGFRASTVVRQRRAFCIPKAVLLAACARWAGIPSGVGLSDVVNHFSTPRLLQRMGGRDVFLNHGWAALHLEGRWLKLVPAFNRELCEHMGVAPTPFDGTADATLQTLDASGARQMEYLKDHGMWSDLPFTRIRDDFRGFYPPALWGTAVRDPGFQPPRVGDGPR